MATRFSAFRSNANAPTFQLTNPEFETEHLCAARSHRSETADHTHRRTRLHGTSRATAATNRCAEWWHATAMWTSAIARSKSAIACSHPAFAQKNFAQAHLKPASAHNFAIAHSNFEHACWNFEPLANGLLERLSPLTPQEKHPPGKTVATVCE